MPLPRPAISQERREQILDGLFEAMAAQGGDAASITEIAQRCGLPRGVLHYYFRSKDEIRCALMQRMGQVYLAGMQRALLDEGGQVHRSALRRLVRFHITGDGEETARLLAVWMDFWGQSAADQELARIVSDIQEGARSCFARALAAAGSSARGPSLDALATVALAMTEGMLLQWRVGRTTGRTLDVERVAAAAVTAVEQMAREVV